MLNVFQLVIVMLLGISAIACGDKTAEQYIENAKTALAQQQQNEAVIALKNAIKLDPNSAESRFLLGKVYIDLRQFDSAEKELERALANGYTANEVVPLLSKMYQRTGADNALAKLSLKKAGLTSAQMAEVKFYQLQALMRLQQNTKAKKIIDEIKAIKTKSPFKQLALVYSLLIQQQKEAAEIQLNQLLTQYPTQPDALKLQANLQLQDKKIAEATKTYRTYIKAYPDDAETSFIFARLLTQQQLTEEAEPIVDKLLKINKEQPLLNQLKSIARFQKKDYQHALQYAETAIIKMPEDTSLRLIAGTSAYFVQDYEKAQQHLSFIADQLPPTHQALRLLAASQLKLGESLAANKTVSQMDPLSLKDSTLFSITGLALLQQGERVKAKALLSKATETNENLSSTKQADAEQQPLLKSQAQLGLLKLSLNDVSGIINIEQALAEDKNNITPAQQQPLEQVLATAYLSTKQYGKALSLAHKWQKEQPEKAKGWLVEAAVYFDQKQLAKAKTALETAQKIEPENADIALKNILLTLQLEGGSNKSIQQAFTQLTHLLKKQPTFVPAIEKYYLLSKKLGDAEQAKAITQAETAHQQAPNNNMITLLMAKIYFSQQQFNQAISTLLSIEDANKPPQYWRLLGQSYIETKQYPLANKTFESWLEAQPNSQAAIIGNILVAQNQRKLTKAMQLIQHYQQTHGVDNTILMLQTQVNLLMGDVNSAQTSYNQLSEAAKNSPLGQGFLGQIQLHNRQFEPALKHLQVAYVAKPDPRNAQLIYGCLLQLKQPTKALSFLQNHLKEHPTDQLNLMQLATEQLKTNHDDALATYQKILTLNDQNFIVQNNVAYLLKEKGQLAEAEQHIKIALTLQPNNIDVLDTYAEILQLQNEPSQALAQWSKAVNLGTKEHPVSDQIYLKYINALIENDKLALARKKLAQHSFSKQFTEKVNELTKRLSL